MTVLHLVPSLCTIRIVDVLAVLEPGGYLTAHIPPSSVTQTLAHLRQTIRPVQRLIQTFRNAGYPVYYTREGHPPSLSTLSSRELFRSRNNP